MKNAIIINYVYFGRPGAQAFFALSAEETPQVVFVQIYKKSEVIVSTFSEKVRFDISIEDAKLSEIPEGFKGMAIEPIKVVAGNYPQEKFLEAFGTLVSEDLEMQKIDVDSTASYGIAVMADGDYQFINKFGEVIDDPHHITDTLIVSEKSFNSKNIHTTDDPRKLRASIEALSKEKKIPMDCISIVRFLRKGNSIYEVIAEF